MNFSTELLELLLLDELLLLLDELFELWLLGLLLELLLLNPRELLLLGLPLLMRSVRLLRQVRRTTTMLPAGLLAPRLGVCEREGFDDMAGKDELLGGAGF